MSATRRYPCDTRDGAYLDHRNDALDNNRAMVAIRSGCGHIACVYLTPAQRRDLAVRLLEGLERERAEWEDLD